MKQRKKEYISILAVLVLIIAIVGISYASFTYAGIGKRENTITTGAISMSYEESSNVISMDKALPTTDTTGKKQLKAGEYFDFTVAGNIVGGETINWEISAEDVTSSTKKIDGSHIKLYLTSVNSSGVETEVMAPTTYKSLTEANNDTGRSANQMSLATGTTDTSFSTKYRLRMYVDENYNPQGDGGDLSFSVKVNVYGKSKAKPITGAEVLVAKANPETLDYATATTDQKNQMWTFPHEATEQLKATTDYRYIGANPNNYVKFNDELWRIIGVFDTDDGTGKIEKRLKIMRNEYSGSYAFNTSSWNSSAVSGILNNNYYNSLKDIAKEMMADAKWYLGGVGGFTESSNGLTSHFYKYERGTSVFNSNIYSTNWIGKIGLIYPSDYGYATSGGNSVNKNNCMLKEIYNWDSDCKNNDWLLKMSMGMITHQTSSPQYLFGVSYPGYFSCYNTNYEMDVYPTVYLKSTIKITGGTGSSTDPFILG